MAYVVGSTRDEAPVATVARLRSHTLLAHVRIEERIGNESVAAQKLAEATARDPKAFPAPRFPRRRARRA